MSLNEGCFQEPRFVCCRQHSTKLHEEFHDFAITFVEGVAAALDTHVEKAGKRRLVRRFRIGLSIRHLICQPFFGSADRFGIMWRGQIGGQASTAAQ